MIGSACVNNGPNINFDGTRSRRRPKKRKLHCVIEDTKREKNWSKRLY